LRVLLKEQAAVPLVDRLDRTPARPGHDVVWASDWPSDAGDEEILAAAHADSRVLVTLDKDFGELAVARGHPHSGIVRLVGFRAAEQGPACG
jgi:predicted nuclease of predicted toxin-antitoxin system